MKYQVKSIFPSEVVRPSPWHSQTTEVKFATEEKWTIDAKKTKSISKIKGTIENPLILKHIQEKRVGEAHKNASEVALLQAACKHYLFQKIFWYSEQFFKC